MSKNVVTDACVIYTAGAVSLVRPSYTILAWPSIVTRGEEHAGAPEKEAPSTKKINRQTHIQVQKYKYTSAKTPEREALSSKMCSGLTPCSSKRSSSLDLTQLQAPFRVAI